MIDTDNYFGAGLRMQRYALHRRLGYRTSRLARIMQSRLEAELAPHRLTRLMWCVLTGVGEEGVQTPSELASYVGVTRPAVSRLLRTLEGRGLLRREGDQGSDGRAVRIALTDRGAQITTRVREAADRVDRHFASKLAPAELAALLDGLERLAADEGAELTDF